MTVKRYECDINGNEYEDATGSYVRASDYDALAARLAEAERLLSLAYDGELWGPLYNDYLNRKSNSRPPDSAPADREDV